MKEAQKQKKTIVCPDLPLAKKALLLQTTNTPGWNVVIEMANAVCADFLQDVAKLDPESEDYERVCLERQRRARIASEFSEQFMRSIHEHAKAVRQVNVQEEKEAVDAVGSMYGIHECKAATTPEEAISRTFGIHPRKPKQNPPTEGK